MYTKTRESPGCQLGPFLGLLPLAIQEHSPNGAGTIDFQDKGGIFERTLKQRRSQL